MVFFMVDSKELLVFTDSTIVSTSSSEFFIIIESKSFCAQSDDTTDSDNEYDMLTGAEEEEGVLGITLRNLV